MSDETKAELMKRTREWLQSCVNAATRSGVPEEADLEAFALAYLDGEPARRAAAREEQREWCARRVGEESREFERMLRKASTLPTPLADELRTLREALERANEGVRYWTDLAQAEARDAATLRAEHDELRTWVSTVSEALGAIEPVSDCRVEMSAEASAKVAESLRARVAELEAMLGARHRIATAECERAGDVVSALEARAEKAERERDELREHTLSLERQVGDLRKMYEKAEAQVAAARAWALQSRPCACGHFVLRAMDEAAKK